MTPPLSRREFLQSTSAGLGLAAGALPGFPFGQDRPPVRVLSIGVVGTIGGPVTPKTRRRILFTARPRPG